MIRFNIARNLLVASALVVLGGCAAPSTSSNDDSSDNPLGHTELVAMDGNGSSNGAANVARSAGGPTPVGIEAQDPTGGPQPEPWNGIDDPNGSPQPEPWRPKRIAPEPDPDQAQPASTPPKP